MPEEMTKEAKEQFNELMGQSYLGGMLYGLDKSGHSEAAKHPEMVARAAIGMKNIEQETQKDLEPVVKRASMSGLEALGEFAEE